MRLPSLLVDLIDDAGVIGCPGPKISVRIRSAGTLWVPKIRIRMVGVQDALERRRVSAARLHCLGSFV
jgi:hypothetical protein